jgi:hypothetical protein
MHLFRHRQGEIMSGKEGATRILWMRNEKQYNGYNDWNTSKRHSSARNWKVTLQSVSCNL